MLSEKTRPGSERTETTLHQASIRLNYLNGNRVSSTVVFEGRPVSLMAQQQSSTTTEKVTVTVLAVQIPGEEAAVDKAGELIQEGIEKAESNPEVASKIEQLTEEAKGLYPKLANKVDQLHHVIPISWWSEGWFAGKDSGCLHQLITNAIRNAAPYGEKIQRSAEQVNEILQKVYQQFPLPPH